MAGVECTSQQLPLYQTKTQGFSKLVGVICYTNDAFRYGCTGDVEVCVICIESTIELPVRALLLYTPKHLQQT